MKTASRIGLVCVVGVSVACGPGSRSPEQRPLPDRQVVQQIHLVFGKLVRRDAKTAQRAKARVDAINGARLRREGFHQLAAALDERLGFVAELAGRLQDGHLPDFLQGKVVAVERNDAVMSHGWN